MENSFPLNPSEPAASFFIKRAACIEAYALLEAAQAKLLGQLLGHEYKASGIIFPRITNAKTRNNILRELILDRVEIDFHPYWFGLKGTSHKRGLFNLLNSIDQRRNEIVHWSHMVHVHHDGFSQRSIYSLCLTDFWVKEVKSYIYIENLIDFVRETSFAKRSIAMFSVFAIGKFMGMEGFPVPEETLNAWQGIFRSPCVYPPPQGHPLADQA